MYFMLMFQYSDCETLPSFTEDPPGAAARQHGANLQLFAQSPYLLLLFVSILGLGLPTPLFLKEKYSSDLVGSLFKLTPSKKPIMEKIYKEEDAILNTMHLWLIAPEFFYCLLTLGAPMKTLTIHIHVYKAYRLSENFKL